MMETMQNPPGQPASPATAALELQPCATPMPAAVKGNPFLTRGSLALLGMYAAGFLALYVLGLRSGPKVALGEQNLVYAKVDAALNLMDAQPSAGELTRRTDATAIVKDFYTAAKQRQVDRTRLAGNPFIFRQKKPEKVAIEIVKEVAPKDKAPAELKAAMAAVKTLRLQSVLVGRRTAALVSNNLITTGQTVKGWTVLRIGPREVELTWKDQKYVLELP